MGAGEFEARKGLSQDDLERRVPLPHTPRLQATAHVPASPRRACLSATEDVSRSLCSSIGRVCSSARQGVSFSMLPDLRAN